MMGSSSIAISSTMSIEPSVGSMTIQPPQHVISVMVVWVFAISVTISNRWRRHQFDDTLHLHRQCDDEHRNSVGIMTVHHLQHHQCDDCVDLRHQYDDGESTAFITSTAVLHFFVISTTLVWVSIIRTTV